MLSLTLALAPSLVLSFSTGTAPRGSTVIAAQRAHAVTMAAKKQIAIGIVGPGLVGGELMAQIEATKPLLDKQGLEVTVAAISELKPDASGKLQGWQICSDKSLSIADFKAALADPDAGEPGDFDKMADFLKSTAPHAVMFDTTASEIVSNMYPKWLAKGVHVVTPNKKVGSGDLPRWKECLSAMEATGAQWGDETTVGAGLPILNILRTDLLATGDSIVSIEGIFSGTLSYIFNTFEPGMKFSDVIMDAKKKGFTEPGAQRAARACSLARLLPRPYALP
jgi:aspartokinase/homoserine dehydrogenase 1